MDTNHWFDIRQVIWGTREMLRVGQSGIQKAGQDEEINITIFSAIFVGAEVSARRTQEQISKGLFDRG